MPRIQIPINTAQEALAAMHSEIETMIELVQSKERYTPEWQRLRDQRDYLMRHADILQAIIDRFETQETAEIESRYK